MSFAILRVEKIKTAGNAGGLNNHLERKMEVPNADPDLRHLNSRPVGSDNLWHDIKKRIDDQDITPRKNAVLAVEHLITYSPEWAPLKKHSPNEKNPSFGLTGNADHVDKVQAFFKEAQTWLSNKYGKENVVNVHIHFDESTPHMHAVVVPIDKQNKLNCRAFLGGREKLRDMQSSFAKQVEYLGLQRGIEGSKAQHIPLKEFYGMTKQTRSYMREPMPNIHPFLGGGIKIDKPSRFMLDPEKWAKQQESSANSFLNRFQDHYQDQAKKINTEVSSYLENGFLKRFNETLELRQEKRLSKKESVLEGQFKGKNKELSTKIALLEKALEKQDLKFDYKSQQFVKVDLQQKEEQKQDKSQGMQR